MALLIYNKTASDISLGGIGADLPASLSPPDRGRPVDITSEFSGMSGGEKTAIESSRLSGDIDIEWTGVVAYDTSPVTAISAGANNLQGVPLDDTVPVTGDIWRYDGAEWAVIADTVVGGSGIQFNSVLAADYDTPITNDVDIISVGGITIADTADGLQVDVISSTPSPIKNASYESDGGGAARDLENWTEEFFGLFVSEAGNGRQTDVLAPFPTDGSAYLQLGSESILINNGTNNYHQVWQVLDFTNLTQLSFDYETLSSGSGGGTQEFSIYVTDTVPSSIGFDALGLSTTVDRVFLTTGTQADITGQTVNVTGETGLKYLVLRLSFGMPGGATRTQWARVDNFETTPSNPNSTGRVFIPIKNASWAPTSDQMMATACTIENVSNTPGIRVGFGMRFQGGAWGSDNYIISWDPFNSDGTGSDGNKAVRLSREGALGVQDSLVEFSSNFPTVDGAVARSFMELFGGAIGDIIYVAQRQPSFGINETAASLSGGQWGLYIETYGAGTSRAIFNRVLGMIASTVNPA